MSVILTNTQPPLTEVSKTCGASAMAVYSFLWESASKDVRYDHRKHLPWSERRDCGGTTSWSISGLADALSISIKRAKRAIDKLLDNGYIQHIGKAPSSKGKYHSIFRVTHPQMLDAVRYSIEMMGGLPSENRTKALNPKRPVYQGETWDITEKAPMDYWILDDPEYSPYI